MFNFLSNLKLNFSLSLIWLLFFFNFLPLTVMYFNSFMLILIWIIVYYISLNKNESLFKFNSMYIYLSYLVSIVLNRWFFFFIISKITFFWKQLSFSNLNFFSSFNILHYKWNPLIKQYSYYGYFKANLPRWNYSHTDEIKKYKF